MLEFAPSDGTSSDDATQTLQTTDEHPFWHVGANAYVAAVALQIGDEVVGPQGERSRLIATHREPRPDGVDVYNFQVEGYHTYFVREADSNAAPVLVHNSCLNRNALGQFTKGAGGYTATAARGIAVHKRYRLALPKGYDFKYRLPSGRRPDAVNFEKRIVRELKPHNARTMQAGRRQLERYRLELQQNYDGIWTSYLDTYNP